VTAIFILVRKNILVETMYYTKILEGLQQKLGELQPLSPIAGAATGGEEQPSSNDVLFVSKKTPITVNTNLQQKRVGPSLFEERQKCRRMPRVFFPQKIVPKIWGQLGKSALNLRMAWTQSRDPA